MRVDSGWLAYCIEESKAHGDAIVGANGRSTVELMKDNNDNKALQNDLSGFNDFVGHTWTLRRELLRAYMGMVPYTYSTGEDMQVRLYSVYDHAPPAG